MARLVQNDKNFKILSITENEAKKAGWGLYGSGRCVCMNCNEMINGEIFYPAVLNDTLCRSCYKEWLERSFNYPGDRVVEQAIFERAQKLFDIE